MQKIYSLAFIVTILIYTGDSKSTLSISSEKSVASKTASESKILVRPFGIRKGIVKSNKGHYDLTKYNEEQDLRFHNFESKRIVSKIEKEDKKENLLKRNKKKSQLSYEEKNNKNDHKISKSISAQMHSKFDTTFSDFSEKKESKKWVKNQKIPIPKSNAITSYSNEVSDDKKSKEIYKKLISILHSKDTLKHKDKGRRLQLKGMKSTSRITTEQLESVGNKNYCKMYDTFGTKKNVNPQSTENYGGRKARNTVSDSFELRNKTEDDSAIDCKNDCDSRLKRRKVTEETTVNKDTPRNNMNKPKRSETGFSKVEKTPTVNDEETPDKTENTESNDKGIGSIVSDVTEQMLKPILIDNSEDSMSNTKNKNSAANPESKTVVVSKDASASFGDESGSDPVSDVWNQFKSDFKKVYDSTAEIAKRSIFEKCISAITKHNEEAAKGAYPYTMRANAYSDMDHDEFVQHYTGCRVPDGYTPRPRLTRAPSNATVPDTVDWREVGAVSPIKDQGTCGSCWAFAAIGSLESRHKLKKDKELDLSEQNLVDCTGNSNSCSGGWMVDAYEYIGKTMGIDTEKAYPYTAKKDKCDFKNTTVGVYCVGYSEIAKGDEESLKRAVAEVGPIAVGIDGYKPDFQNYGDGIYYDETCDNETPSHAVLVIGYGTENGYDYWLIKNSWGESWGMDGYGKMARNKNNHCGIANYASYPLVEGDEME